MINKKQTVPGEKKKDTNKINLKCLVLSKGKKINPTRRESDCLYIYIATPEA